MIRASSYTVSPAASVLLANVERRSYMRAGFAIPAASTCRMGACARDLAPQWGHFAPLNERGLPAYERPWRASFAAAQFVPA
jgi:hypothetical protein